MYNGYYINSVDSNNYNTAHGFNYHQGPVSTTLTLLMSHSSCNALLSSLQEWLWVTGYFLRAKLQFAHASGSALDDTISRIHEVLSAHAQALQDSPWAGLPELTNKDGAECSDSCPVQAWSMACLLDVLYDIHQLN